MKIESGMTAVITGGASGMGFSLAEALIARGLNVVVCDIEQGALDTAIERLSAHGGSVLGVRVDVTDRASIQHAADLAEAAYGQIDLLVPNAGVIGPRTAYWLQRPIDWKWVMDVNYWGVINALDVFLPRMVERGSGHVVVTSSMAGLGAVAGGGNTPYAGSKFGVVGVCETLEQDLKEAGIDIGVTVLCPGRVVTNIHSAIRNRPAELSDPDEAARLAANPTKFPNLGAGETPEDVAKLVIGAVESGVFYLVTDDIVRNHVKAKTERLLKDIEFTG